MYWALCSEGEMAQRRIYYYYYETTSSRLKKKTKKLGGEGQSVCFIRQNVSLSICYTWG